MSAFGYEFGQPVVVTHEAIRVIGTRREVGKALRHTGTKWEEYDRPVEAVFNQSRPVRSRGRYNDWPFLNDPALHPNGSLWPGLPVPEEWQAGHSAGYGPYVLEPTWTEPTPQSAYARIRRMERKAEGFIIGETWREEGIPQSPTYTEAGDSGWLARERRVPLIEVVLSPLGKLGKACIVLAHENDLEPR